jgi:ribosomal protein S20
MDKNEENVYSGNLKEDYKDALKNLINLAEESLEDQDFDSAKTLIQGVKRLIELEDLVDMLSDMFPRKLPDIMFDLDELDEPDDTDELDEPDDPDELDEPDDPDELDELDDTDELDEPDDTDELDEPDDPDEINLSEDQPKLVKLRRTPLVQFIIPILESIIELGGEARVSHVLNLVHSKMKGILKRYDYVLIQATPYSPIQELWEDSAQLAKDEMVVKGLIAKNTPRGIWAITEKGKKFYEENKNSLR